MFSPSSLRFFLFNMPSATAITAGLLLLCPASAHAQGGVPLWTKRYNGSPPGYGSGAGRHADVLWLVLRTSRAP